MATYKKIMDAQACLVEYWGEDGKAVIVACSKENPFNNSINAFLDYCSACGGNWGGMLLTGIRRLYPKVWDAIPDDMGASAFTCICKVLDLLGVDI